MRNRPQTSIIRSGMRPLVIVVLLASCAEPRRRLPLRFRRRPPPPALFAQLEASPDLDGTVVGGSASTTVVIVMASWCSHCRDELAVFDTVRAHHPERALARRELQGARGVRRPRQLRRDPRATRRSAVAARRARRRDAVRRARLAAADPDDVRVRPRAARWPRRSIAASAEPPRLAPSSTRYSRCFRRNTAYTIAPSAVMPSPSTLAAARPDRVDEQQHRERHEHTGTTGKPGTRNARARSGSRRRSSSTEPALSA